MKIKIYFRIITIFLALGMVFSLAAKGNNEETTTKETTESTTIGESATEVKQPDPLGKYEPPINLTSVKSTSTAVEFAEGQDWDNNDWTKEIERVLGIKVEYLWTADSQQYNNKLNVTIASGDLPDFFSCNPTTLANLVKSDSLSDLNEIYGKYASPMYKQFMNNFKEGFESGIFEGKLFGLSKQGFVPISSAPLIWIREDWRMKFGLEPPKTFDDVIKIAEAFANEDPDGNGKEDTYGLGLTKNLFDQGFGDTDGIFAAFHAYPYLWIKDDAGKIVYGGIQPEVKDGLKTLQDMYKKGLIDQEFGVKDASKVVEEVNRGKIGIMYGDSWNANWPYGNLTRKEKIKFLAYDIVSADDQPALYPGNWPVNSYFVASKECKYPESLIKMINFQIARTNSNDPEEIKKFDITTEYRGSRAALSPVGGSIVNPEALFVWQMDMTRAFEARSTNALHHKKYMGEASEFMKYLTENDYNAWPRYYQVSKNGPLSKLRVAHEEGKVMVTELQGMPTETMIKKMPSLEKMRDTTYIEIILGASLDKFDEFVEQWKKLGGDQITEEMNEKYGNR